MDGKQGLTLSRCEGDKCSQILRTICARSVLSAVGTSVNHDFEDYRLTEIDSDVLSYEPSTE